MWISDKVYLEFDDVLIRPNKSELDSRKDVNITREFKSRWHKEKILKGVPIITSNMYHPGTLEMARALKKYECWTALDKSYSVEEVCQANVHKNAWFSIGESDEDLQKLDRYLNTIGANDYYDYVPKPMINMEVANAFRTKFIARVKEVREKYPHIILMVGDVANPEATKDLVEAGADIVRVGIGVGSVCVTRWVTGIGVPILSLVMECSHAAHNVDGLICCDGGIRQPGDLAKAFGAGADFVMSGHIFAGHDQCRGDIVEQDGKKYMKYFGSASQTALDMRGIDNDYRPAEGITKLVEYKGSIDGTMKQYLGGLRSSMTYMGTKELKEVHKKCDFVRIR